jgi:methionyl-tRNA formyltransferase
MSQQKNPTNQINSSHFSFDKIPPNTLPNHWRIGFAGTPEFAAHQLQALIAAGLAIQVVLTQPDRQAGRGLKTQFSPVKTCAREHGIPVMQPYSLKKGDDLLQHLAELQSFDLDFLIVAAYGLILPKNVLDMPKRGCINVHASLLPRWRGAAPIVRAIEAGDQQTGICLMQMDEGLDTGHVLLTTTTPINPTDTSATLDARLSQMGAEALLDYLQNPENYPATPQSSEGVCYAHKLKKEECTVDWKKPAKEIVNKIRAFDPFSGLQINTPTQQSFKVWKAQATALTSLSSLSSSSQKQAGQVLLADPKEGLIVACGEDGKEQIQLLELQKAGGKRLPAHEFLRGFLLSKDQLLS